MQLQRQRRRGRSNDSTVSQQLRPRRRVGSDADVVGNECRKTLSLNNIFAFFTNPLHVEGVGQCELRSDKGEIN